MNRFLSILPSPLLAPYIKVYWFLSTDSIHQGKQRAIPSGCAGLIFNRGGNIYSEEYGLHPRAYLFGQSIRPVSMYFDNLNEIACKCGYYDKSHLIREVKSMSGYTPNEFLSNADPYTDSRSLFQSFFVDIRT